MTVTDPTHVTTAAALRHAYQHPDPDLQARADGASLVRDLSDYDKAFGIDAEHLRPIMRPEPGLG